MSLIQRRKISFDSITSIFRRSSPTPATNLGKPLTSLPNASGAGAFSEPISYQVLGLSHNLLNIKLPKSSILNIRYSNTQQRIVAMNGDINSMYSEIAKINESNVVFQRCFNQTEAMSLLIAQNSENSNFAVANTEKSNWFVKRNSLFAWSGPSIKPYSKKSSKLALMKGEGTFIISSPGQLIQLNLNENENIEINADVLVAYTSNKSDSIDTIDTLNAEHKSQTKLSVGGAPFKLRTEWISRYISIPSSIVNDPIYIKISTALSSVLGLFKSAFSFVKKEVIRADSGDLFINLKGPKTIMISNSVQVKDKVLSSEEIDKLIA